jgi:hypothetical protein
MTGCIRRPAGWAGCWPRPLPNWRPRRRRDAGGSRAAAPLQVCRARLQPGSLAGRSCAGGAAQDASGVAAHAGLEHADAAARHREPGRPDSAPAAAECARSFLGLRSGRRHAESMFCSSTTFFTTGATARAAARRCSGRSGLGVGGHAGQGAPHARIRPRRFPLALTMRRILISRHMRRPQFARGKHLFIARPTIFLTRGKGCRWEKP